MKIRREASLYDKEQPPYLTSTQLVLFDEFHIQQVSGPPVTINVNEQNTCLPRYEEVNIDVKNGKYDTNNPPKKAIFKYEQVRRFCLGVDKIESKNGKITGKQFPVFNYSGVDIGTIDAYKKEIQKEFARVQKLTSSLSHWV